MIRGLRLTLEAYEELGAFDLSDTIKRFQGRALLVGISRTGEPGRTVRELSEQLESAGAATKVEVLRDPLSAPFGDFYVRISPDRLRTLDTRIELDRGVAELTAAWAAELVEATAPAGAR